MGSARLVVVGLGPSGREHLTFAAHAALASATRRFARTRRHPAVVELEADGMAFASFDDVYDASVSLDATYDGIVDRIVAAVVAADPADTIVYAVPGSPWVAEGTVRRLLARAESAGVGVGVVDGLSFVEPTLAAVRADALDGGLVLLDGRALVPPAATDLPVLIAQVDSRLVLGEVKLALLERYAAEHPVALVDGADASLRWAPLAEIDHDPSEPGPLASLWVPAADTGQRPFTVEGRHLAAGRAFADLVALQDRLRAPGGCPWDAEQTHHSLRPYLLEEAYEVTDALDALGPDAPGGEPDVDAYLDLEEELGDFLYQSVFHACLAHEAGIFDAADVVRGIVDKLVARHPHVFGDEVAASAADVLATWESRKAAEKQRESALDGVPRTMPALGRTAKLRSRAVRAGAGPVPGDAPGDAAALGAELFRLVVAAETAGLDAEAALRAASSAWEAAWRADEAAGIDVAGRGVLVTPAEVAAAMHHPERDAGS